MGGVEARDSCLVSSNRLEAVSLLQPLCIRKQTSNLRTQTGHHHLHEWRQECPQKKARTLALHEATASDCWNVSRKEAPSCELQNRQTAQDNASEAESHVLLKLSGLESVGVINWHDKLLQQFGIIDKKRIYITELLCRLQFGTSFVAKLAITVNVFLHSRNGCFHSTPADI